MGRINISGLPFPQARYRIDLCPAPPPDRMGYLRKKFESFNFAEDEDAFRADTCETACSELVSRRSIRRLARKLGRNRTQRTLASSRYWRRFRIRIIGTTWKLVAEGPWDHRRPGEVAVLSVAPRCWEFTPAELNATAGHRLMAQLRTWLNRQGAAKADGFLIACLHGEFEPNRGVYRVHAHGVVAGGMIAVVSSLRDIDEFNIALDPSIGLNKKPARVVVSRKPISNLPHTISYQFKSYWLSRWIGSIDPMGTVKRARCGQRIDDPYATELLVWFDRHELQDVTLLMKLRVGKQGFVLTQSPPSK